MVRQIPKVLYGIGTIKWFFSLAQLVLGSQIWLSWVQQSVYASEGEIVAGCNLLYSSREPQNIKKILTLCLKMVACTAT